MSKFRLDINKLKEEYIGQVFNWLTVIDVFRDNKNKIMFKCQCKCGNIKDIPKKLMLKSPLKSCGCYKHSEEFRLKKSIISKEIYENNPDIKTKQSESRKQWYKNNPDKAKELSDKLKQLYINEPERRDIVGKRVSEWFLNDKEGVANWSEHRKQYYKNHPEIGMNRSNLYKEHPEIIEKIAEGNKQFNKEHPEKVERINNINRQIAKEKRKILHKSIEIINYDIIKYKIINNYKHKRILYNINKLLEILHPDYYDALLSGDLASYDIVKTKCPMCNEYCEHKLHNVFIFNSNKFKNNVPPLCSKCMKSHQSSQYEDEIANYISTFYSGEIIRNTRDIINPLELDIYIPDKNIAIEFNGDYWHSDGKKCKNYHYNKFIKCKENRILLVSIFESEWNNRKDEIKEYLKDLFNGRENKLSFNEDYSLMNNNYPSINYLHKVYNIQLNLYKYKKYTIYTCGYSLL